MPVAAICSHFEGAPPADSPNGLCPFCLLSAAVLAPDEWSAGDDAWEGDDWRHDLSSSADENRIEGRSTVARGQRIGTSTEHRRDNTSREVPQPDPLPDLPDYEIMREIARGAMGVVYEARHQRLGRVVALKMIKSGVLAGEFERLRFGIEAGAAARLDHPGIVPVYEFGEVAGKPYYSMAYIKGRSLAQLVEDGPLPPERAGVLIQRVAEAVHFAHKRGVIHRDLKPSNILVDETGRPRVTDFGLAKRIDDEQTLTHTGAVMGTPSFMPPEQARAENDRVNERSDVYSLGATLYALTTGKPPFRSSSTFDTLRQILECDPAPPRQLNTEIDRDLETVCLKCLEKDQSKRYESAQALADDLGLWLRHEPIRARRASAIERVVKLSRRRPAGAALLGVIAAAVATIAALGVRDIMRNRETIREISAEQGKTKQSASQAIIARNDARREAAANLRRLVKSAVGNGNRFVENGNPLLALPWYVHALKNEPDGQKAEQKHRIRLASVLGPAPRLTRLDFGVISASPAAGLPLSVSNQGLELPAGQILTRRVFSPDGKRFLTTSRSLADERLPTGGDAEDSDRIGMAIMWDAETKRPVFPPVMLPLRIVDGAFVDGGRRFVTAMEIDEYRAGRARNWDVTSELRVWNAVDGRSEGAPVPVPFASIRVEVSAAGDRMIVHGNHVRHFTNRNVGASECLVLETQSLTTILPRSGESIRAAQFNPDGNRFAAAAGREERTPEPVAERRPPNVEPGVRIDADGHGIFPVSGPIVRLYAASDGEPVSSPLNHEEPIERLVFAPDGKSLISSGHDLVRFWEMPEGRPLAPSVSGQRFLEFSPDGDLILMVTARNVPQVWRIDPARRQLFPASPPLPALGWSPIVQFEPGTLVASSKGLTAEFTSAGRAVEVKSRDTLSNATETRTWLLHGGTDSTAEMMSLPDGAARTSSSQPPLKVETSIRQPAERPNPKSSNLSGLTPIVLAPDLSSFIRLTKSRGPHDAVPITLRTGERMVGPDVPAFELFTAEGRSQGEVPKRSPSALSAVQFGNPRCVLLLSAESSFLTINGLLGNALPFGARSMANVEAQAIEIPSLAPLGPMAYLDPPVGAIAFSPDGRHMAVVLHGTEVPSTPQLRRVHFKGLDNPDKTLARLDEVRTFDLTTGKATQSAFRFPPTEPTDLYPILALQFSPDGQRLLVRPARPLTIQSGKYEIPPAYLLDARSLRPVAPPLSIPRQSMPSRDEARQAVTMNTSAIERQTAFSRDGRLLAFADRGNALGVFDTSTGSALDPPPKHVGQVLWVGFSRDGTRLLTTGTEGVARVWDTASGAPVGRPIIQPGIVQAEFSPDGSLIITAGAGGRVRVWDGESAELLMELAEFTPRVLSFLTGPDPHRVTFVIEGMSQPVHRDIAVEERPLEEVEAISIVLSGHVVGTGEELMPAPLEQIQAARSFLLARDPDFFDAHESPAENDANSSRQATGSAKPAAAEAKSKSASRVFPTGP